MGDKRWWRRSGRYAYMGAEKAKTTSVETTRDKLIGRLRYMTRLFSTVRSYDCSAHWLMLKLSPNHNTALGKRVLVRYIQPQPYSNNLETIQGLPFSYRHGDNCNNLPWRPVPGPITVTQLLQPRTHHNPAALLVTKDKPPVTGLRQQDVAELGAF